MSHIYQFKAKRIEGQETEFSEFKGKVLLIVNTASECGFTPQYEELESLYRAYGDKGLVVLGFPCNQFGGQEPGSNKDIAQFCAVRFGVTFPLFEKTDVNGENAHPLWKYLKAEAPGILNTEAIKWNFTKFLVSRDGGTIKRFAPSDKADVMKPQIEAML